MHKPQSRILARTALVCVAAVSLVLTGCTSQPSADAPAAKSAPQDAGLHETLPKKIQSAGYMTIATDPTYPPFEFYDKDGTTIIGADAELSQALGKVLGVELRLEPAPFDNIIPGLSSGKYDAAMSGMADTREREKTASFVTYMKNAGAFLVRKDSKLKPMSLDDICGATVAVQSGTTMNSDMDDQAKVCADSGEKQLTVMAFKGQDQVVQALRSKRADVGIVTAGSGAFIVTDNGEEFEMTDTYSAGSILGIVLAKDNTELAEVLKGAMQKVIDDGSYEKILTKWGLFQLNSIEESTINGAES